MKPLYKFTIIYCVVMLVLSLTACSLKADSNTSEDVTQDEGTGHYEDLSPSESSGNKVDSPDDETEEVPETSSEANEPKGNTSIRIRAVGDIMMHSPQIPAGKWKDGTYDFKYFFEEVKPYLDDADITLGNFECTIGDGSQEYTGYPLFRSPAEIAEALAYAGFDVLTTANNHSFDGREFGVGYTLDQLDANGILHTGTARSMEERNQVLIVEEKGVRVAILSYTYGTNGMEGAISTEKLPYMVNYIDKDKIHEDILRVKEAGADVIVTAIHWGNEYQRTPDDNQEDLADYLISEGVDVILGSHPHVIQPMEKRLVTLEDGTQKEVFIMYSLGNFLSNQYWQYSDSGVIVDVEIIKNNDTDEVTVGKVGYIPTWVQRTFLASGNREYKVLPVAKYRDDDSLNSTHSKRVKEVWNETTEHLKNGDFLVIP